MAKLYRVEPTPGTVELGFECPGCGCAHSFRIEGPAPTWSFNGDFSRPTFAPSLLVRTGPTDPGAWPEGRVPKNTRCHLFLRDGQLQYLSDCTHELAGRTITLAEVEL